MKIVIKSKSLPLTAICCIMIIVPIACNNNSNDQPNNAVVRDHPYSNATLVIVKYLGGEYSINFINDREMIMAKEAIMYVNLWNDLDICRSDRSTQYYESLEANYFSIKKEGENTKIVSKIHKDLLLFKLLIVNDKTNEAAMYAAGLNLDDYGIFRFYPLFLKIIAGHFNNKLKLSKEEILIPKDANSVELYKGYKLVWALWEWDRRNLDRAINHIEDYKRIRSNNLFVDDIFKVLQCLLYKECSTLSCFQRSLFEKLK